MARPEIIAAVLHRAYHDWLWDRSNPALLAAYNRAVEQAATVYLTTPAEIKPILARDFHAWRKQENLPLPPWS